MKKLVFTILILSQSTSLLARDWSSFTCVVKNQTTIPDHQEVIIPAGSQVKKNIGKSPSEIKLRDASIEDLIDDQFIYFENTNGKVVRNLSGEPIYHWLYSEMLKVEPSLGGNYYLSVGAPGRNDIVVILVDAGPFNTNKEVNVTYRGINTGLYLELNCKE